MTVMLTQLQSAGDVMRHYIAATCCNATLPLREATPPPCNAMPPARKRTPRDATPTPHDATPPPRNMTPPPGQQFGFICVSLASNQKNVLVSLLWQAQTSQTRSHAAGLFPLPAGPSLQRWSHGSALTGSWVQR